MKYLTIIFVFMVTYGFSQQPTLDVPEPTGIRAYGVKMYLVQRLPVVNNALLPFETTVFANKYPTDINYVETLFQLPEFIRKRGYKVCKDCPFQVVPIKTN